jgi:DNA-binding CsgD family transcriptional regulator
MEAMLCPVLVGRSAELQALVSAVDAAAEGRGGAVFGTGEPGIGKSRLAREVAAEARSRNFLVLHGRASESTVPVPFRPIAEALMGASRAGITPDSPGMSNYRAALGSLIPEWSRPGDSDAEVSPLIIGEALLRMLSLPELPGGLLVLEDLHWADPETIAIVEYLADNIADTKICCLITIRDTEPSTALDLLASLTARRAATIVEVSRLTQDNVMAMATACLNVDDPPPAVSRMLASCEGLPFAVEEILAAAVSSGELLREDQVWSVNEKVDTGVPPSIVGSVRNRIAALGPHARAVIVSAALLGRQFDWTLLPAIADVSKPETLDVLQRAHRMQLIEPVSADADSFRFRHSLTRAAIVSALLPPELAQRAERAASEVEAAHPGLPGPWCELAAELRTTAGQPADAARLLLTAGRRAVSRGAIRSADAALRKARQLFSEEATANDGELRGDIDEALAEVLALSGDYEQLDLILADLLGRLDVSGADRQRAASVLLKAGSALPQDHNDIAAERIATASELARELDNAELTGRIDAMSARTALVAGQLDRADRLANRSLAAAKEAGLNGWAAEVAVTSLGVLGHRLRISNLDYARAAYQRASEIAEEHALGIPRLRTRHFLAAIDMLADGDTRALTDVQGLAYDAGLLSSAAIIELQLANFWSMGTNLDQALTAAVRCEQAARRLVARHLEAFAISHQAMVHGIRGADQKAHQLARRAEATLPGDPTLAIAVLYQGRVITELFRDDIARAVQLSVSADPYRQQILGTPERARGFFSSAQAPLAACGWGWGLHALLQAASGGDIAGAIELATAAAANDSLNRGCLAYAEAVRAGQAGRPGQATALAAEGSEALALFAPWWNHLAQRLIARQALRDNWGQPAGWMRDAAAAFAGSGHAQLAAACRGILRQAGERVPRAGRGSARVPPQLRRQGVTSREMDVYLLVGQGYSNAEIAQKLFISPKTVETHVASLAAKTHQAGRRALVAHAARGTATSPPTTPEPGQARQPPAPRASGGRTR